MWHEPQDARECTIRFWRIILLQFGSIFIGLIGRIGIMMSIPFLVFTPPELADDFADRMDSWVDDHISRMDALEAELDRLEAWRARNQGSL